VTRRRVAFESRYCSTCQRRKVVGRRRRRCEGGGMRVVVCGKRE
jgi:hypothetical protein